MTEQWTKDRLELMIQDEVEESLTLEYKAADSLNKSDTKKKEMTKDVSAMANSAGGTIIYGIKEYDVDTKRHLPEKIDPVRRVDYSKEWIEQVLSNIDPRITDLIIHPVPINSADGNVAYVVEVPKGDTAHQAQDLRYYKRYNFQSVPMHDYEVRDVMGRSKYPIIDVRIFLASSDRFGPELLELKVSYRNIGAVYAQYVNGFVQVPCFLLKLFADKDSRHGIIDGVKYEERSFENIHKDMVDAKPGLPSMPSPGGGSTPGLPPQFRYVTRYDPLLPGLGRTFTVQLGVSKEAIDKHQDSMIRWTVYADNSPKREGRIRFGEIKLHD